MTNIEIIKKLPYSKPFLFVDEIIDISDYRVEGTFFFDENLDFYKGHFVDNPVTPGVILTETMAQIGLVCLGIYLMKEENKPVNFALTSVEIDFLKPVFPNETVTVISEKIYYRFGKLKCKTKMINAENIEVCNGFISGMITNDL